MLISYVLFMFLCGHSKGLITLLIVSILAYHCPLTVNDEE